MVDWKIVPNEPPVTEEMERSQTAYDNGVALDADIERLAGQKI